MANSSAAVAQKNPQPLFYKNPIPVLADRHAEAGISKNESYGFAKEANSAPLNVQEFQEASKHYAIAFTADDAAVPVAILGFKNNENLYVGKDGNWEKNTYIPAYVRRYPFAFTAQEDKLILCVDEESDRFVKKAKKDDFKLFEDKQDQSQLIKNALNFCQQFHQDNEITRNFSKELKALNLFVTQEATFNVKGVDKPIVLSGFNIVDQKKFLELPADIVHKWHKNGYLALINWHLSSLSNIAKLPELYLAKSPKSSKK